MRQTDFGRQAHDALDHLDDVSYLQTHPLAREGLVARGGRGTQAGKALRQALLEGIEALRPGPGAPANSHAWRGYQILTLRHVEGLDVATIQDRLGVGKSEYYRDYRKALDAMTSIVRARWGAADGCRAAGPVARLAAPIPSPLTSFVGRERELDDLCRLVEKGVRLITLTGPGGSGKSRLALQAAKLVEAADPGGVWLAELAALTDPDVVPLAVAVSVGLREEVHQPIVATLADYLQARRGLLILDNCEHLIGACAALAETLLGACPGLQILASSRESLGIPAELIRRVPPLAAPDPEQLPSTGEAALALPGRYDAVRLFVDRATAAEPSFALIPGNAAAVARLCGQLDGLPLAIELAAAQVKVLTVEQIAERLGDSLHLLTRGSRTAASRHQTLRALFDWSHDLLAEPERRLLRRLAVFAGSFSLEAAEWVSGDGENGLRLSPPLPAGAPPGPGEATGVRETPVFPVPGPSSPGTLDVLAGLVEKSLVLVDGRAGEARYRLLETTRQYARERLVEAGEAERIQARCRAWYIGLVEGAERPLWGKEQVAWLDRLKVERHNLRLVLAWCRENDVATGLRLVGILWRFWWVRGFFTEGRRWLEGMLAASTSPDRGELEGLALPRARALLGASFLAREQGDLGGARSLAEKGLALFRRGGDTRGIAMALFNLALVARSEGAAESAVATLRESLALFREIDDDWGIGETLYILGTSTRAAGDYEQAEALLRESLARLLRAGDAWGAGWALGSLGNLARLRGDDASARALYEDSLARLREAGDAWGTGWTLAYLGNLSRSRGAFDRARAFYRESLAVFQACGASWGIAYVLCLGGIVAVEQGNHLTGVRLIGAAAAHRLFATSLAPDERAAVDASLAAARENLGNESFARAREDGRSMPPDQAIALAMEI